MYLKFSGVKAGHVRYNPELFKELSDTLTYATCLTDLFVGLNRLYGMPLKQVAEPSMFDRKTGVPTRIRWVNKNKLYKVELALRDDGTWFLLGKRLNLSQDLIEKLSRFHESLRVNETYVFEHPTENLFVSQRDYFDDKGRHIKGLTISKVRFMPNTSKAIMNEGSHISAGTSVTETPATI